MGIVELINLSSGGIKMSISVNSKNMRMKTCCMQMHVWGMVGFTMK